MGIAFYFPTQVAPTLAWVPPHQPMVAVSAPVDFPAQIAGETAGGVLSDSCLTLLVLGIFRLLF